jgi:predicted acyl esterase
MLVSTVPGKHFVQRGYIYVHAIVRGTSRSGGEFDVFGPRSAQGRSRTHLLGARLPHANGKVVVEGCSFLGINQLEAVAFLGHMQRTGERITSPRGGSDRPEREPCEVDDPRMPLG